MVNYDTINQQKIRFNTIETIEDELSMPPEIAISNPNPINEFITHPAGWLSIVLGMFVTILSLITACVICKRCKVYDCCKLLRTFSRNNPNHPTPHETTFFLSEINEPSQTHSHREIKQNAYGGFFIELDEQPFYLTPDLTTPTLPHEWPLSLEAKDIACLSERMLKDPPRMHVHDGEHFLSDCGATFVKSNNGWFLEGKIIPGICAPYLLQK